MSLIRAIALLTGAAGLGAVAWFANSPSTDGPVPKHHPGKTGYRLIDAMMPKLRTLSSQHGIPLGLLIGWIARESGGRIGETPKPLKGEPDAERGYFQLTPSESRALGLDHQRLSTDPDYSLDAGIALIKRYSQIVDKLGVATAGSEYYWKLVKLAHTMGSGALNKIAKGAAADGAAGSWEALTQWAYDHEAALSAALHHSPKKWLPHVDKLYAIGRPFGFGSEAPEGGSGSSTAMVGSGLDLLGAKDWSV